MDTIFKYSHILMFYGFRLQYMNSGGGGVHNSVHNSQKKIPEARELACEGKWLRHGALRTLYTST